MDFLNLAKERYLFELDRKDKISGTLSIPLGIATLTAGLIITFSEFFCNNNFAEINIFFKIFAILYLIALITSFYYFIRCFFQSYFYAALPKEWMDYYNKLKEYYAPDGNDKIDEELDKDLTEQYATYAEKNANSNEIKLFFLTRAKGWLICVIIFGAITLAAQYCNKYYQHKTQPEIGVHILSIKGGAIMTEEEKKKKPKPPQGRKITEGAESEEIKKIIKHQEEE